MALLSLILSAMEPLPAAEANAMPRIGVVEDDRDVGAMLQVVLQRLEGGSDINARTVWWSTAAEAMDDLETNGEYHYDLMVIDYNLGQGSGRRAHDTMNGADFARWVRSTFEHPPSLFLLTAIPSDLLDDAEREVFDRVLFKPIDPATLQREIRQELAGT